MKSILFLSILVALSQCIQAVTNNNNRVLTCDSSGSKVSVDGSLDVDLEVDGLDCQWVIETVPGRILLITLGDVQLNALNQDSFYIHDGTSVQSPALLFSQHAKSSVEEPAVKVYSKGNSVLLRVLRKAGQATTRIQLKIEKAVNCPFNLGASSSCGRVLDDVSCYCISFSTKSWADAKAYCNTNGFTFYSIESAEEDAAVNKAWDTNNNFWTSLTDVKSKRTWVWDSTGAYLFPGWGNWCAKQPDLSILTESCMASNYNLGNCWKPYDCSTLLPAICELQP